MEDCGDPVFCRGLCKRHYSSMHMAKWRAENPEKDRAGRQRRKEKFYEYQKKWVERNREKRNAYCRNRYLLNIEDERKYQREWKRKWRRLFPEKSKESESKRSPSSIENRRLGKRLYAKTHRGIRLNNESIRRARKRGCEVEDGEPIKAIYKRAQVLRSHGIKVHVDHIIPLSKGGKHSPGNLQIIPEFENAKKHTSLNYEPIFLFQ